MKVNGPGRPGPVDPARKASRPAAETPAKSKDGEQVRVSTQASLLAAARAPEVPDSALVQRIREAIDKGAFEVDAERIADIMLQEETE